MGVYRLNSEFYLTVIITTSFILFCGNNDTSNKNNAPQQITSEAAAVADSLEMLAKLHRGFVGVHAHGKSLKLHAHQNPSKKARVFKTQSKIVPLKKKAMQKANEEREKRIKKILEEKQ